MWIPKSEEEIRKAVNSDSLEETATFDAKLTLPSKNIEIAKDIAAMSNDGGVIIYGIGEDENRRLTILSPITLEGQPERISSVAQTSIAEPPRFHIHTISTQQDPSKGYIIVAIPPSERAPHMVTVNGDHRYYGRNAKGNILLSEAEVGRLYERRKQLDVNLLEFLNEEIQKSPYPPNPRFGYLHIFVRPTFELDGILEKISTPQLPILRLMENAINQIANQNPLKIDYYPRFNTHINNWGFTSRGVRGKISFNKREGEDAPGDALILNVDSNGVGHLFCGRAAELENDDLLFFWQVVVGNTVNFMLFMGEILKKANYIGMVEIGLAITGINNAIYYSNSRTFQYTKIKHESNEYKSITRIDAASLIKTNSVLSKTKEMLSQLIRALTQGYENPFDRLETTNSP